MTDLIPKITPWSILLNALIKRKTFRINVEDTRTEILKRSLSEQEEGIFKVRTAEVVKYGLIVTSGRLAKDICDEKRFRKASNSVPFKKLREAGGDGLFTAHTQEPSWKSARNILNPAFTQRAMKQYFPMMVENSKMLVKKWSRSPHQKIDVTEDLTKVTLEMIGKIGFGYSFGEISQKKIHPFIRSMNDVLSFINQYVLLPLPLRLFIILSRNIRYRLNLAFMKRLVGQVIQNRKKGLSDHSSTKDQPHDILDKMLLHHDKETGVYLSEKNMSYQIITFLIAGHETTSGLLSFALYLLIKNPKEMKKVQEEVDAILGDQPDQDPSFEQITSLKYIQQVLKETLRLYPTAPFIFRTSIEDTTLGDKYKILKDQIMILWLYEVHRDKKVWGDDSESFSPERFSPKNKERIPLYAYHPFGVGKRNCIGKAFAMLEATLILGLLIKHFVFDDFRNYRLKITQNLSLKPKNFYLKAQKRAHFTII